MLDLCKKLTLAGRGSVEQWGPSVGPVPSLVRARGEAQSSARPESLCLYRSTSQAQDSVSGKLVGRAERPWLDRRYHVAAIMWPRLWSRPTTLLCAQQIQVHNPTGHWGGVGAPCCPKKEQYWVLVRLLSARRLGPKSWLPCPGGNSCRRARPSLLLRPLGRITSGQVRIPSGQVLPEAHRACDS